MYSKVWASCLENITLPQTSVTPVIHPPRRVPVPLREKSKEKLAEMVQREIIKPVTEPTAWVSSMLVVVKPDKLRICIDPRNLNKAICCEHYQMPTIDEVVTRLTKGEEVHSDGCQRWFLAEET